MRRFNFALRLAAVFCLAASSAAAQQGVAPSYGHEYWDGPWHGWFMGPLMMVLFLAFLVIAVVVLVRWINGSRGRHPVDGFTRSAPEPLDILKERFARGEIDKTEYEERRNILMD